MHPLFRKLFPVLVVLALLLSACQPRAPLVPTPFPTPTSQPNPTPQAATPRPATQPPPTVAPTATLSAEIEEIKGTAEKRADKQSAWDAARIGQALAVGNQVRTADESLAAIRFASGSLTRLAPNSLFTLTALGNRPDAPITRIELALGKVFILLFGSGGGLEVETPAGVAAVRGSLMSVEVTDRGEVIVTCLETLQGCR
ncbi:MAG: FecR domain-containing protein, partial [Anaerolineales bacterium]